METRSRKRLRGIENSDKKIPQPLDKSLPKSSNSNRVKQFDGTIPALVADIFLTSLRDVQLLKTCRSVCKTWNITASESLRTCSLVRFTEGESTCTDFTNTLIRRSFGPLQHVSSPFQNFRAEGNSFTNSAFVNFTLQPNITITSLKLKLDKRLDQSKLGLVLAANKGNITDLKIVGTSNFVLDEALLAKDDIQLVSLTHLEFDDRCDRCTHMAFMRIILKMCTLESVDLRIQDGDILSSVLSQEKVRRLKHLTLDFKEISRNAWEHLSNLRFLRLKTLKIHAAIPYISLDYLQKWRSFCYNLPSNFLVEFETNIRISTKSALMFPSLRILKIGNNNVLSVLTHERFPCLVKVIYVVTRPLLRRLEKCNLPHEGFALEPEAIGFSTAGLSWPP
ncbi:unnamed protein product [Allacma fusca]|uniref:Uncharacterized protein n=1 Tax=Allacma fusca TaxID=39272 RepID=A0A8J2NR00_9HEXA|nr:unnamed protein product [Allacma fusca]